MASANNFTATGVGTPLGAGFQDSFDFSLSGTYAATMLLEVSTGLGSWKTVLKNSTANATVAGTYVTEEVGQNGFGHYRWKCDAFTSGTAVTSLSDPTPKAAKKRVYQAQGLAKVGGTAGWLLNAADNVSLATLPQSSTASKLNIPIPFLKIGDKIISFHLIGRVNSAGGAVSVDCDLRFQTATAASTVDTSLGTITQLAVTAQTLMSEANTKKVLPGPYIVGPVDTVYASVTSTTAASTDVAIEGICITMVEA
jgi:hypothetical protein